MEDSWPNDKTAGAVRQAVSPTVVGTAGLAGAVHQSAKLDVPISRYS